jgi:hypothetical protein
MHKKDRALFWLEKGFKLLPCQPNSKYLVGGFGQYRSQITSADQAAQWFDDRSRSNMAVVAPDDFYILDFDLISVYAKWADTCTAARSYTETSPNEGRHVFLHGTPPHGIQLVKGVEIKQVVLVAPSAIDGRPYKIAFDQAEIIAEDPVYCLSSLSQPGHATPNFLRADQTRRAVSNPLSHIDQIKAHFTISHVLKLYRPEIKFSGRGDFQSCVCPFHRDSKPSFWFNDSKGLWGCHACNVRGDVINLYARFEAVNVIEAIRRMWAVMA